MIVVLLLLCSGIIFLYLGCLPVGVLNGIRVGRLDTLLLLGGDTVFELLSDTVFLLLCHATLTDKLST